MGEQRHAICEGGRLCSGIGEEEAAMQVVGWGSEENKKTINGQGGTQSLITLGSSPLSDINVLPH
jgi:hypothetical protein